MTSFTQPIFMAKMDCRELFLQLDHLSPRYWIMGETPADGQFSHYRKSEEIDNQYPLGQSTFGTPFDLTIGIQLEPYLDIPKLQTPHGLRLLLPMAGVPLISTGGEFRTGEVVSGRVAFSMRCQYEGKKFTFANRLEHYDKIIRTFKECGATNYENYLVGFEAW